MTLPKLTKAKPKKERIHLGEYITFRKNEESGIWYVSHPDRDGRTKTYSTGIKGSAAQIKQWSKDANLQPLIEVGMRTKLTTRVINQITNRHRPVDELAAEWLRAIEFNGKSRFTVRSYKSYLNRFLEHAATTYPHDIQKETAYAWINETLAESKYSTKQLAHAACSKFWQWMKAEGHVDRNFWDAVPIRKDLMPHALKEKKKVRAPSKDEFDSFIIKINDRINKLAARMATSGIRKSKDRSTRPLANTLNFNSTSGTLSLLHKYKTLKSAALISYGLGLRAGDVACMEWDCLGDPGWFIVHTDKSDKRIAFPYMTAAIEEFLQDVPEENRATIETAIRESAGYILEGIQSVDEEASLLLSTEYVFPMWKDLYQQDNLSGAFADAAKRFGFGYTFHGLRHARIRRWKQLGLTLEQIGKLVGHSSTSTTEGYLG